MPKSDLPVHADITSSAARARQAINAVASATFHDQPLPNKVNDLTFEKALREKTDEVTARGVWREAEIREQIASDPTILGEFMVRAAYRIVREFGRLTGTVQEHEALHSLSFERLYNPQKAFFEPPRHPFCIKAFGETQKMPLPVLPTLRKSPETAEAPLRERYTHSNALRNVAVFLGLPETDYGGFAMPLLIQSPIDPRCWPGHLLLMQYEDALISNVLNRVVERGARLTEKWLVTPEGGSLMPHEATNLVRLAKAEARARQENEIEEDRAIMAMRLEDMIARAREAFDMRLELGAIKQLTAIKGLIRATEEDTGNADFARLVDRVVAEAPAVRRIPQSGPSAGQTK